MAPFRKRCYELESAAASLPRRPARSHPLRSEHRRRTPKQQAEPQVDIFDDPLRGLNSEAEVPITRAKVPKRVGIEEQLKAAASEWEAFKLNLVQKFPSSGTISVSSQLNAVHKELKGRGISHLQQLEDPEKESELETVVLTQQEYVTRLKDLNREIAEAWDKNERVTALRLSMKAAKLLMDTSVPSFYPTLFIMVTNALDTLGNLVWDRIKEKAEADSNGKSITLPVGFSASDISLEARDTCSNWFLKIGSIRELLPRIYLEIAILRCVRFLQDDPSLSIFQRLSMMIRGLAHPLASAYARAYLARKGLELIPQEQGYLVSGMQDFSRLYHKTLSNNKLTARLNPLVEPVFEWVTRIIFKHTKQEETANIMVALCGRSDPRATRLSMLVHYVLKMLPASFVANHATDISRLVKVSSDSSMPQFTSFILLVRKLCECLPPRELRVQVLDDIWQVITKYQDKNEFLAVADVVVEYVLQCCSEKELHPVLEDIQRRAFAADVKALSHVQNIVVNLLAHYEDLGYLLAQEPFLRILDVLYGDARISTYKSAMAGLSKRNMPIEDPVTRGFCFEAAKVLHDSLDSFSSEDVHKEITHLVVRFVQLVHFGRDLEHHLGFLLDCRAAFRRMDAVKEQLVHVSNRLVVASVEAAKGHHPRRTADFVKACITFNEISIPQITAMTSRLHLFLATAEVALMSGLLSHTESLLKSGILCLQEDEGTLSDEQDVLGFIQKLCSFLILVPGDPELGALYFLRGLLNLIDSKLAMQKWRMQVLCGLLMTISALSQERAPYHVTNEQIASNDVLYFGDLSYQAEIQSFAVALTDRILSIAEEEPKPDVEHGCMLLDASNAFLLSCDVNARGVADVVTVLRSRAASMLPKNHEYFLIPASG